MQRCRAVHLVAAAALLSIAAGCGSPAKPSSSPATTSSTSSDSSSSVAGPTDNGGGGLPAGIFDGTYQGLHVSFDIARGQVSNFHAAGSWTCGSGPAEMVAVVPGSFPVHGDSFTIDANAPVGGHETHWMITGQFNSAGASGSYTAQSDAGCARDGAIWRVQT